MDYNILEYMAECQFAIFGIPIRIFNKWELLKKFDFEENGEINEISDELIKQQLQDVKFEFKADGVAFHVSPNLLAYGIVNKTDSKYTLVLGPCRSMPINDNTIKDILIQNNIGLEKSKLLSDYINNIPMMNLKRFAYTLSYINANLNQTILSPSDLYEIDIEYKKDAKIYKDVLTHNEKVVFGEIQKSNIYDFLKRQFYFVQNGITSKIKNMYSESVSSHSMPVSSDALRQAKNSGIASISLFSWAAMSGGLDADTAFTLQDLYIEQIEHCKDLHDVMKIRFNSIYDFCERVRAFKIPLTDDPSINRAMSYIIKNVDKKITVEDIATMLKMNSAYLSVKFKKIVGTALADYINIQKINEAKYLLKFTKKPLVEISNYLMFSSQSYFQKLFKKYTMQTPKEYRNSKE